MHRTTFAICAAIVGALLPQITNAADLSPVVKAPLPVPALGYTWTGCYVGVSGGGAWGHSDQIAGGPFATGSVTGGGYNVSGGLVGGGLGCNYQVSQWVFGVDGDISWVDKSGSTNEVAPFNPAAVVGTQEHWLATVRGRIGFTPFERWLLYVHGGFAAAGVEATLVSPVAGSQSQTQNRDGWTAGVGVETAFWHDWSAKLEYLHVDFGSLGYFNPSPAPTVNIRSDVPLTNEIVRAGINWHF
jgi:outer membrane immunogenic protein